MSLAAQCKICIPDEYKITLPNTNKICQITIYLFKCTDNNHFRKYEKYILNFNFLNNTFADIMNSVIHFCGLCSNIGNYRKKLYTNNYYILLYNIHQNML